MWPETTIETVETRSIDTVAVGLRRANGVIAFINREYEQCVAFGSSMRGKPFEKCSERIVVCLPPSDADRYGDGVAIFRAFGGFRNITTVGQTISFMRPTTNTDVLIYASVQKLGKNIVFGEVVLTASGAEALAAHATATWALIP